MKTLIHYYMVLRRKIIRRILRNSTISHFLSQHCLKCYLAMFYENWVGKCMNYRNPKDLNQALIKVSWENSKNPRMRTIIPMCVDKYAVREYIASHGFADTLNECYGVYDNIEAVDFDSLPNQFVMKMTNASGRNYICTDKSVCDWSRIKEQFREWLEDREFAWQTGEWQYAYIKPRVVVEKYLADLSSGDLIDYKVQVFNGKAVDFFVCYNRDNAIYENGKTGVVCYDCYDVEWNRTEDITSRWHPQRQEVPQPKTLARMIHMAEECSKDFSYCRFDVYEINGKLVFGEMTFTPHGNIMNYYTDEYLERMKDLLV